ncbi:uncharacterized protein LOC132751033 [Ruditapes philippinarum]|uniref:uncharacterized protein LOC132751033 n=1 Tax=Ruditapes philippinarum TaxID=129788 RepID=UPI00295B532D|nr:uncharacterized protein LOC132751033 [Ruditapes philippinarum]
MNLLINLGGNALGGPLSDEQNDYDRVKEILREKFEPNNRSSLYKAQFRSGRQRRNETIQDLASSIKELTRKSFPGATYLSENKKLSHTSCSELRFYVQQSIPETLQKAVLMTQESQLFLQERRKSMSFSRSIRNDDYNQAFQHLSIDNIEDRLAKIENSTQQPNKSAKNKSHITCFHCGKNGHMRKDCDSRDKRADLPYNRYHNTQNFNQYRHNQNRSAFSQSYNNTMPKPTKYQENFNRL